MSRSLFGVAAAVLVVVLLWALRDVVLLVAFAVLLAYALDPVVSLFEKLPFPGNRRMHRRVAAATVMLVMVLLLVGTLNLTVPRLVAELGHFVQQVPEAVETLLIQARAYALTHGLAPFLDPDLLNVRQNATIIMQWMGTLAAGWVARLFSGIIQILGFAVLPVLTFYLLAEEAAVRSSAMAFVPADSHDRFQRAQRAVDRALRSYVRGQGFVCVIMGTITGIALAALGIPMSLLLGVVVGIAEVVPFLGFALAAVAIGLAGASLGLGQALIGVAAYTIINQLVSLFITPRVMGQHLKMHPFVVTVSILAGAQMLGPAGAIVALPGAAMIQALIAEFGPRRGRRGAEAKDES